MKFSKRSLAKLEQASPKIKELMQFVIETTDVDFGIAETLRTKERQEELFRTHKSKTLKSKHLTGDAVDIFIAVKELNYDRFHLIYLAGIIKACSEMLGIEIRWGGNWDKDSIIIHDQTFQDLCHFELC